MIAITCSACQEKFSVQQEPAGMKVKCPGCGQWMAVPVAITVNKAGNEDMATPQPNSEPSAHAPSQPDASAAPTHPPSEKPDATLGVAPDSGHDASLIDFLAPPQADDELGRLGKYRILKILGHGGMGVVYKGEDLKLKRTVAIKAMLPALAASASCGQRFLREAEAMAAVEHDHIVRIYQIDEERNIPFMAMEFLKGEPLDERLKRDEPIALLDMLRIGREIAEGLGAAHSTGLIHRDIKPGNIWLEAPRNRVKILDFGLARAASKDSGLTQQGAIIGTPAYMSPEQGRGETVDPRSDLFSLGVVLYRMGTGQQPFVGKDTVSTLMAVAMNEPAAPIKLNSALPPEFSDLVMKLLDKDPAKRTASAGEVIQALQGMEKKLAWQKMAEEKTEAIYAQGEERGAGGEKAAMVAPSPGHASDATRNGVRRPLAFAAMLFLGVLLVAGAGTWAMVQMGIIRISTPEGDFVVNTDDPDFKFSVSKDVVLLEDSRTKRTYKMKAARKANGEYELDVADVGADLLFKVKTFTIKRGEEFALKATFEPKQLAAVIPPVPPGDFALRFNNVPDLVTVPTLALDISSPFTMEGYFKQTEFGAGGQHMLRWPVHAGLKSTVLTANRWNFQLPKAGKGFAIAGNTPVILDITIHVAAVSDTKHVRLYVNGALVAKKDIREDKPAISKKQGLQIGHEFNGVIDEVRISKVARYDKDFTPAKRFEPDADTLALYHFDEGQGDVLKDSSGHGHHGKIVGAKWVRADGTPSTFPPLDPDWLKRVAALPAKEQMEEVKAELIRRNPGTDDKIATHKTEGGVVRELEFRTTKVKDISPVRALTGLQRLKCRGTAQEKSQFADLSPLEGTKLTFLMCSFTQVSDLTPIKDLKLTLLHCQGTRVPDLSLVKDMPLTELHCGNTPITDLSPLKGMKLTNLDFVVAGVSDLTPLQGMPLTYLGCHFTKVTDLSPLKGMPLTFLKMENTRVSDIASLKALPLTKLDISFVPKRDAAVLRSIPTLQTINGQSKEAFWKEVDSQDAGK